MPLDMRDLPLLLTLAGLFDDSGEGVVGLERLLTALLGNPFPGLWGDAAGKWVGDGRWNWA